jgi:hypothetical protein
MTETQTTDQLPDIQLAGDPVDTLTIPELRVGNAKLRADIVHAITRPTEDRWDALALVAWLHAKRVDPRARLETFTKLTVEQIAKVVAWNPPDPVDQDVDLVTGPTATIDDVARRAAEDPTGPTPAP